MVQLLEANLRTNSIPDCVNKAELFFSSFVESAWHENFTVKFEL